MKNRLIVIYVIVVSLIYAFAVGFFTFNIVSEYKNGYNRTQLTFDTMAHNVKSAVQKANPETFEKDMAESIGSLHDYMSIEIKLDGQKYFSFPDQEVSGGRMTRSLFKSDKVNDINIFITANLYLLRPYTIFSYARISFLIILVTTLITIMLLIYFNFVEKQLTGSNSIEETSNDEQDEIEYYEEADQTDETSQVNEENQTTENIENEEKDSELDIPDYENIQNNQTENEQPESSENANDDTKTEDSVNEQETVNDSEKQINENSPAKEEASEVKDAVLPSEEVKPMLIETLEEEKPSGLFSPVTGFGWEQYLHTRLENELRRATASEIDLALFIIKIPGMDKNDETILNICKYISEQFQFADLVFEYKQDCFAAIKIAINLDEALTFADKLHLEIENQLAEQGKHCFIGISTRTIRLISADRILKEAEEALIHAEAEPSSPIIAFRANVTKYNEFVERN